MRRLVAAGLVVLAAVLAPSAAGQVPKRDSVTGTATVLVDRFDFTFTFDAHSGPSGEHPSGTVTTGPEADPVLCLRVNGTRATIEVHPQPAPPGSGFVIHVEDKGSGGDAIEAQFFPTLPTSCPAPPGVSNMGSGDITVVDAQPPATYTQCRQGGWVNYGYASHAQCIDAVHESARQKCIFERVATGIVAFRAKYGQGPTHDYAMRHCVRLYTGF